MVPQSVTSSYAQARRLSRRVRTAQCCEARSAAHSAKLSRVATAVVAVGAATLEWPDCALAALAAHAEPANALSLATWIIHTSSVSEWVVAMWLFVDFAERWRRPGVVTLAWAMLPLHFSSLCACTYHFFYNSPAVADLVTLQAASTCVGNATLAIAAVRCAKKFLKPHFPFKRRSSGATPLFRLANEVKASPPEMPPFDKPALPTWTAGDTVFFLKLAALSVACAVVIKYGSLFIDAPFEPSMPLGVAIIFGGTAWTGVALALRCTRPPSSPA